MKSKSLEKTLCYCCMSHYGIRCDIAENTFQQNVEDVQLKKIRLPGRAARDQRNQAGLVGPREWHISPHIGHGVKVCIMKTEVFLTCPAEMADSFATARSCVSHKISFQLPELYQAARSPFRPRQIKNTPFVQEMPCTGIGSW